MIKALLTPTVALAIATIAVAVPAAAQQVVPVQFARGTSSAALTGSVRGYSFIDYRLSLRAGQQLSVSLQRLGGSPYFNILEPGSRDVAIYNSSMGDQTYSGVTGRSGTYTIRVYQMRAAARRGEVARFRLRVSASAGVAQQLPGDAMVPGTPYHATSTIRCIAAQGMSMGSCRAGVIRRAAGSATVHLDTPDGGQRTILFRDGTAVSSDSRNTLRVMRRGDTSVIRIGTVEVYEIPDALVLGG